MFKTLLDKFCEKSPSLTSSHQAWIASFPDGAKSIGLITQLLLRCFVALKSGWRDHVFTARFKQVNVESSIFIIKSENLTAS